MKYNSIKLLYKKKKVKNKKKGNGKVLFPKLSVINMGVHFIIII